MNPIVSTMQKLIGKRFYATAEAAQGILDVFFAVGRISAGQYAELTALAAEKYAVTEGE